MSEDSALAMFLRGLLRLLRLLWKFIRSRIRFLLYFLRIRKKPRRVKYLDCLWIPDEHNLRPDPYIYSQDWLKSRGLSYSWDNPDIEIIDTTNGSSVGRHDLIAGRPYEIKATISNHSSTVWALDTIIMFQVKEFGVNGLTVSNLAPDTVDVPNGGHTFAKSNWTPANSGHYCIVVTIVHSNDANAQNNVGQHNTDVSKAGEAYNSILPVRNDRNFAMTIKMAANTYRLPEKPMRAKSFEERNSLRYLRSLQEANSPKKFPVPEAAGFSCEPSEFDLGPGESVDVRLQLRPDFVGQINVDALSTTGVLLGGVTIIGEAES